MSARLRRARPPARLCASVPRNGGGGGRSDVIVTAFARYLAFFRLSLALLISAPARPLLGQRASQYPAAEPKGMGRPHSGRATLPSCASAGSPRRTRPAAGRGMSASFHTRL